jgi:serine/threonine protein phosphatase PrpC
MSNWKQLSPSIYHRLALGSVYGVTDVGLVRQSNQDNFLIDTDLGLVAVADGMGGHEGGEIASFCALSCLQSTLRQAVAERSHGKPGALPAAMDAADPDATWRDKDMPAVATAFEAVEAANREVFQANVKNFHGDGGGMGTTLTGFWQSSRNGPLIVFHVGDSRLYRYRKGELSILTRDQTLYQQALEEGLVDQLPPRNVLLQAIGPTEIITPEVKPSTYEEGDVYLLCSDGLYGNTPHGAISEILVRAHAQSLEDCCGALIELAKSYGSRDNITAVLALCHTHDDL